MTNYTDIDFLQLVGNFRFEGEFIGAVPYGFGHINDTYAASFKKADGSSHRYILQRINNNIFKNPEQLMNNIELVTGHIKQKFASKGADYSRQTLNIIYTNSGKSYFKTNEDKYWRAYVFIEGARTYQIVENENHLYNAGNAFGKFQNLLSDFEAGSLYEVIPDFHNTGKRYSAFMDAVNADSCNRASGVKAEIDFVNKRAQETVKITELLENNKLPVRVTHNDTKFNNVMIDDVTGEGICVVDLDTVMPGSSLYDFGDAIRSGTNPADEDEKELSKVCMDLRLFENYTRGYLDATRNVLTPLEIDLLPLGAKLMTLECGIRFLTDYLNGDVYFKIHRDGHNLDRCRTQFKMVEDIENKWVEMKEIVEKYR
ncbi:MAG: mdsC [Eubacterium sp.]|nr:mdsC [Eubacterium sp.]